jgi:ZIP family zinc transporter
MVLQDPNVRIAFGLVLGAGAATAVGASVVFFPSLVKLASRRLLAGALGASAGVMLYVSFVEIFSKTMGYFQEASNTPEVSFAYTTCCFFGGIVFMMIMDNFIHWLGGCHRRRGLKTLDDQETSQQMEDIGAVDPIAELEQWQDFVVEQEAEAAMTELITETARVSPSSSSVTEDEQEDVEKGLTVSTSTKETLATHSAGSHLDETSLNDNVKLSLDDAKKENDKLVHMGLSTAVAIGLHNFPEGLAAFVAALGDVRVGFVFALAIAIHNIPEGLCVALPIYYGTKSRCKAFGWACLAGMSEPFGALLGWAILINHFTSTVYAILFGIVAGMMVFIVIKELVPTAHRYDPEDSVVTYCIIAGMALMALSLVLFAL